MFLNNHIVTFLFLQGIFHQRALFICGAGKLFQRVSPLRNQGDVHMIARSFRDPFKDIFGKIVSGRVTVADKENLQILFLRRNDYDSFSGCLRLGRSFRFRRNFRRSRRFRLGRRFGRRRKFGNFRRSGNFRRFRSLRRFRFAAAGKEGQGQSQDQKPGQYFFHDVFPPLSEYSYFELYGHGSKKNRQNAVKHGQFGVVFYCFGGDVSFFSPMTM